MHLQCCLKLAHSIICNAIPNELIISGSFVVSVANICAPSRSLSLMAAREWHPRDDLAKKSRVDDLSCK